MCGKALLADEVGLGKTIEIGTILAEMYHRGTDDQFEGFDAHDYVIASADTERSERQRRY